MREQFYFVDTSVLLTAKIEYYAFDLVPAYWNEFLRKAGGSAIFIPPVVDEINTGRSDDELKLWFGSNKSELLLWEMSDKAVEGTQRVLKHVEGNYRSSAVDDFASVADSFLCGFAHAFDYPIVSCEKLQQGSKKRIKIPNVCKELGIKYMSPFQFMRELKFRIDD